MFVFLFVFFPIAMYFIVGSGPMIVFGPYFLPLNICLITSCCGKLVPMACIRLLIVDWTAYIVQHAVFQLYFLDHLSEVCAFVSLNVWPLLVGMDNGFREQTMDVSCHLWPLVSLDLQTVCDLNNLGRCHVYGLNYSPG